MDLESLNQKFLGKLYIKQGELVSNLLADTSKLKVKSLTITVP